MDSLSLKLEELQKKDKISLLELEFGRFLYSLASENSYLSIISGMICVQEQISGHICTRIDDILSNFIYKPLFEHEVTRESLSEELLSTTFVGKPGENQPLILEGDKLYLQKFWKYELELADFLLQKSKITHSINLESRNLVDNIFDEDSSKGNNQKTAVLLSLLKDLVIISGGPGTGKTFTVKKIIEVLNQKNPGINIALSTPTGKAAQRLNESLEANPLSYKKNKATTIHKLLGARGTTGTFKYHKGNKLPYDVLIVDEASMLDISLWIHLIRAIKKDTKLILLGDKNQLSSVEAGSILGDICSEATETFSLTISKELFTGEASSTNSESLNDCIIELTKSYRFGNKSGIKLFAESVNSGNNKYAIEILKAHAHEEVISREPTTASIEELIRNYVIVPFLNGLDNGLDFEHNKRFQILCALRKGPYGTEYINAVAERELKKRLGVRVAEEWYEGRPVIITKNNSLLKVRNGEIGICIKNHINGLFEVVLEHREDSPISVSRVQDYEPAFATTIHKSQGSEYDHVAILLSNQPNPLLTRQLLYTAVTRARESVLIIGSSSVISSTIVQSIVRRSGLKYKIWNS